MFYKREILPVLMEELNKQEIVVITGMRQVGKTTILKYIYDNVASNNKAILDAGNPIHRKIFDEINYDNIIHNLKSYGIVSNKNAFVFIDEIQNMPELSKSIKYLYDHYQVKFFVTGSSSYYLKNLFPESLAGRKYVYELFPLSFNEFLGFKGITRESKPTLPEKEQQRNKLTPDLYNVYLEEYLKFGGFPGVVNEENNARKEGLLENLFKSYFEIDVKELADFKNLSNLRDLILLLIPRIGSKLDISKLSSEIGISRETIYSYLSFLEQTYFISMIPKYSSSLDRKSAGSKKLYFCDCGLANYLGKLSDGQLLENAVYQNLKPHYKNICYYSKKSGAELDFILDGIFSLEVKQSADRKHIINSQKFSRDLGLQGGFVTSKNYLDEQGVIMVHDL